MSLPIIGEETNNGSRPLGHRTIYGVASDDNSSILSYSTTSTAPDLPGAGRLLGNLYSSTGRRLERTLGDLAHRAGFSPEAIYQQISTLYLEDWKTDGKKASMIQKLCFKLLKHTKSIADSTGFVAIMRWRDILRDQHEIYVWLFFSQQERMVKRASALLRVIAEFLSTTHTLSDFQDAVLSETSLLIDCHSVGLNVLSLNRARLFIEGGNFHLDWTGATDINREGIGKWDKYFQYLLSSLSDPTTSRVSRWYIDFWSSQIVEENMHLQIALQSCRTLQCALEAVNLPQIDRWDALQGLCKEMYILLVRRFDSDTLLLDEGAHISSTLNDLTQLHDRVFSPKLGSVPNLACLTMLGSTDLISPDIKENIISSLKILEDDDDEGPKKKVTETMFLRSCNKLIKRALFELNDTECLNKLSNATSFTNGTSRCAILQLSDILQSLPKVYMLLITLGGDEIRDSLQSLRRSLDVSDNSTSTLERYPRIVMGLRLLLACHSAGLWLAAEDMLNVPPSEGNKIITRTAPSKNTNFREARELFVPYLTDNLTFNPLIFYLKCCISQVWRARHVCYTFLSCSIVHGALLTEKSVPQESRSAMEELCRTTQNSIIEQLSSAVESTDSSEIKNFGQMIRSVYTDLTESRCTAFKDEAEDYLSQLCNLLFDVILAFKGSSSMVNKETISELASLFDFENFCGWLLSIRGPDAAMSMSWRLCNVIDDSYIFKGQDVIILYERQFQRITKHEYGVILLAPRNEKLRIEGAGLAKHPSTNSSEPPLTPEQRERWTMAFRDLVAKMSPWNSDFSISLFYFANCPLPFETDPVLDTAIALRYCENLQHAISKSRWYDERGPLSRAVYHIHTCLTKRVEFVRQSCTDLAPDEAPTFYGTPFEIPKVVKVLNDLAKLSMEKLRFYAPKLLPIPDY